MNLTPCMQPLSRFGWIRRRARRIQKFYRVSREMAVHDAWLDYINFIGA